MGRGPRGQWKEWSADGRPGDVPPDAGAPPPPARRQARGDAKPGWPTALSHLRVARGTEFSICIKDPQDWHRNGLYRYVVVGWDAQADLYEAWEPSGLHTRRFSEAEITTHMRARRAGDVDVKVVAAWGEGELSRCPLPEVAGDGRARTEGRDALFAPKLSGWKPYGTLEMAGPLLFHLDVLRQREPGSCRSICDIGAGTGRMASWCRWAWNLEASAYDPVLPEHPEYEVQQFDGRSLPLENKSVDVALFAFVLHHCRHFEVQRALLREAARVSRTWLLVAEDTPADERDRKAARGHDHLGTFQDADAWRRLFRQLKLQILHEGPLWRGTSPSPYPITRNYWVLRVPEWLVPARSALRLPGLSSSCCAAGGGGPGCAAAAVAAATTGAGGPAPPDLRGEWLAPGAAALGDLAEGDEGEPPLEVTAARCGDLGSFEDLLLPPALRGAIDAQGFVAPTAIQRAAVPLALAGSDLVGVAATGSGKTLAFLLPSLLRLLSAGADPGPFVLVLAPTRELVLQIHAAAEHLLPRRTSAAGAAAESGTLGRVVAAAAWGGGVRWEQKKLLRSGAQIVVATPGRLLDFAVEAEDEGKTLLSTVQVLILDEGDRMLEEGMSDQLDALAARTAPVLQTLFFSATWPEEVGALARKLCRASPVHVRVGISAKGTGPQLNRNISQRVEVFNEPGESEEEREARKLARLLELLAAVLGPPASCSGGGEGGQQCNKALVFCMTKKFADGLVDRLGAAGWPAAAVHGNKAQKERLWNLEEFASGESRVLVATDVLGRGLDIPQVTHVFIYDFPHSVEEYAHRIGRTARGVDGRGDAVAFFEFVPSLPDLATELIDSLEAAEQPVPGELRQLAADVASGALARRDEEAWRAAAKRAPARGGTAHWDAGSDAELPMATDTELGQDWHAGGQRSWLLCAGGGDAATGWLVFHSEGRLRTDAGEGKWRLTDAGRMVVEVGDGGPGALRDELQLHLRWGGRRRENFSSADGTSRLTGWVTKSKQYRYETPA